MIEKRTEFKVLDHGYIKYIDSMGSDEEIVEAARMSTGRGFVSWEPYTRCKECSACWADGHLLPGIAGPCFGCSLKCVGDEKFSRGDLGMLNRLWADNHATPFEMVELHIEVQAPIMVFREWMRHRTQSYNEFSARYSQMPNLHYLPEPGRIQKQSTSNKQGSAEAVEPGLAAQILAELEREQLEIYEYYDGWVENGIAKEVARLNTPVSRYSKMRAKANLRNWLGFCSLRMDKHAQWEIRQYAKIVGEQIIKALTPHTWAIFEEYSLYGARLSRTEKEIVIRALEQMTALGSHETPADAILKKLRG